MPERPRLHAGEHISPPCPPLLPARPQITTGTTAETTKDQWPDHAGEDIVTAETQQDLVQAEDLIGKLRATLAETQQELAQSKEAQSAAAKRWKEFDEWVRDEVPDSRLSSGTGP